MLVNDCRRPVYGGRGNPPVFLLPGLAVACARYVPRGAARLTSGPVAKRLEWGIPVLVVSLSLVI